MTDGAVVRSEVIELVRCLRGVTHGWGAVAEGVKDVLVGQDILMLNLWMRLKWMNYIVVVLVVAGDNKYNAHSPLQLRFC